MVRRRFTFRLARLLRIREVHERQAREAWAATEAQARLAAAERERRRGELDGARARFAAELAAGPRDARTLLAEQAALDGQLEAVGRAGERLHTREAQAAEARRAWTERDRDRNLLEELRERARTRHRAEVAAQDQAEMDEVAMRRAQGGGGVRGRAGSPAGEG